MNNIDVYSFSINNLDDIKKKVNNVSSDKHPESIDIIKILKKPYVYISSVFILILFLLWNCPPKFISKYNPETRKTDFNYTWWIILSIFLTMIISFCIFMILKKIKK